MYGGDQCTNTTKNQCVKQYTVQLSIIIYYLGPEQTKHPTSAVLSYSQAEITKLVLLANKLKSHVIRGGKSTHIWYISIDTCFKKDSSKSRSTDSTPTQVSLKK